MHRPARPRLILVPPLLIALVTLVAWLSTERFTTRFAYEQATEAVRTQARIAADLAAQLDVNAGTEAFDALADRLGGLSGLRVTYIDVGGKVLGDSRLPALELQRTENHADRPEIRKALEVGESTARRFSTTLGADLLYVAMPYEHGERRGIARAARPLLDIELAVRQSRWLMLGLAIGTIVIASSLVFATTRHVLGAIERERDELEQSISDRLARIARLQEASSLLAACKTIDEAGQLVRAAAQSLLPGSGGALALFKASRNMIHQLLTWGDGGHGETLFAPTSCWALRRGTEHYTTPDNSSTRCAHLDDVGDSTVLCLPLKAHGEILGLIQVAVGSVDQLSGERLALIKTMSEHAAIALGNIQLNEMLREQAIRDPLTGLYNRRYLAESLEQEIARARRRKDPLSVLMIDIDHFKSFNDRFGHEAGDFVLNAVGQLIGDCTRGEDIACRYGGEEFVLVLVGSNAPRASDVGQRLCDAVRHLPLSFRGQSLNQVSVSVGGAVLCLDGDSSSSVLQRADQMLYRAKQSGRNRVVVSELGHVPDDAGVDV